MRILAFLLAFLPLAAFAEDAQDVRGTASGCKDVTANGSWTSYTSASLENASGSTALASGLYWTEIALTGASASVAVCTAAAAGCGVGSTDKRSVAAGAVLVIPLRGISTQTIALYAANGTTVQLCGYFRSAP